MEHCKEKKCTSASWYCFILCNFVPFAKYTHWQIGQCLSANEAKLGGTRTIHVRIPPISGISRAWLNSLMHFRWRLCSYAFDLFDWKKGWKNPNNKTLALQRSEIKRKTDLLGVDQNFAVFWGLSERLLQPCSFHRNSLLTGLSMTKSECDRQVQQCHLTEPLKAPFTLQARQAEPHIS